MSSVLEIPRYFVRRILQKCKKKLVGGTLAVVRSIRAKQNREGNSTSYKAGATTGGALEKVNTVPTSGHREGGRLVILKLPY